jgi:hypothetical protein
MVLSEQQVVSNIVCQTCGGTGIAPMPTAKDAGLAWDDDEFDHRFRELVQVIDVAFEDFNRGTISALRAPTNEDMRGVEKTVV